MFFSTVPLYSIHPFYLIDLNNLLLQGQKLMMMGTVDEIVKSPEKGTVFVEDLPEEEQVAAVVSFSCFHLYINITS